MRKILIKILIYLYNKRNKKEFRPNFLKNEKKGIKYIICHLNAE
jgi:hypothetical protein